MNARSFATFAVFKRFYCNKSVSPKVCIVGAGPAGFYAAQHLAKKLNGAQIDILERLPVPFGLVRFGVAPDHPEVKNVINTFTKTAEMPNVNFVGNVSLGNDISLKQLQEAYHAVLLTYGADENRKLDIPGEELPNVIPARKIVGWYNGTPWDVDLKMDLSGTNVAIFGQGNVAIDVARILLTPIDDLKKTDITEHALEAISRSKIKKVFLVGRRGPLQAAFTIKELREMLKLTNCRTEWTRSDFDGVEETLPNLARPKKRITELMLKSSKEPLKENCENVFIPKFFRAPLEFKGKNKVETVKLAITKLEGNDILNQKAIITNETEEFSSELVVTSIGYKSLQIDENVPFDFAKGIAKNTNGKIAQNLYTAGWLGTGPTGVILTTMSNAFAIAEGICKDLQSQNLENKPGIENLMKIIKSKNVPVVDWNGWKKIDKYEQEEGEKLGKPREKLLDINKMLKIAL